MSLTLLSPLFSCSFEHLISVGHFTIPEMLQNGVYCISCDLSDRVYIGSASGKFGFAKRFDGHLRHLLGKRHHSWGLYQDFKRYGQANFHFHILELCKAQECVIREQFYLDLTQAGDERFSYNIRIKATSPLGTKASEATKQKMSQAQKLRHSLSPMTTETKLKISLSQKGKTVTLTQETRIKISESHKKRVIPLKQIQHITALGKQSRGKKLSEEHRKKLSESHKGFVIPDATKEKLRLALLGREITEEARAKQREKKGGRYLITDPQGNTQEIIGITYFCKQNNLCRPLMLKVATGKRDHYKGWICKRLD